MRLAEIADVTQNSFAKYQSEFHSFYGSAWDNFEILKQSLLISDFIESFQHSSFDCAIEQTRGDIHKYDQYI